jgi:hypothetical protein
MCFAKEANITNLFNQNYAVLSNPSKIKDFLLEQDCLMVELLDLGYDGSSLFIYTISESTNFQHMFSLIRQNS